MEQLELKKELYVYGSVSFEIIFRVGVGKSLGFSQIEKRKYKPPIKLTF